MRILHDLVLVVAVLATLIVPPLSVWFFLMAAGAPLWLEGVAPVVFAAIWAPFVRVAILTDRS